MHRPKTFWKVRPPSSAAIIISLRASSSLPRVTAFSRSARPVRGHQRDRFGGRVVARERKVSMQWVSASIPVAAVSAGGNPKVSSGSQTATFGNQVRRNEPELPTVAKGDESRAADFAAGSRRRRNRDHGGDQSGDLRDSAENGGVAIERRLMGREQRNRFGEVDRRAAADGDEAVAIVRPIKIQGRLDRFLGQGSSARPSNTARSSRAACRIRAARSIRRRPPASMTIKGRLTRQARKVGDAFQIPGGSDLEADIRQICPIKPIRTLALC